MSTPAAPGRTSGNPTSEAWARWAAAKASLTKNWASGRFPVPAADVLEHYRLAGLERLDGRSCLLAEDFWHELHVQPKLAVEDGDVLFQRAVVPLALLALVGQDDELRPSVQEPAQCRLDGPDARRAAYLERLLVQRGVHVHADDNGPFLHIQVVDRQVLLPGHFSTSRVRSPLAESQY
jgi:hypothetical protein